MAGMELVVMNAKRKPTHASLPKERAEVPGVLRIV